MSLRTRLFIDRPLTNHTTLQLNKEQSHYICNVLRFNPQESLRIFNGCDGEWRASIISLNKKQVTITVDSQLANQTYENELHLAFCLLKNITPSFIVQKATELGVTHIWPIISKRTVITKTNMEKLEKSAIEAAEQCERLNIPKTNSIILLKDFLSQKPFSGSIILCDEKGNYMDFTSLQDKIPKRNGNCILIGPEGGWSEEEVNEINSLSFAVPINFGPRIMRAETAAIAAISAYNTAMNNWN